MVIPLKLQWQNVDCEYKKIKPTSAESFHNLRCWFHLGQVERFLTEAEVHLSAQCAVLGPLES